MDSTAMGTLIRGRRQLEDGGARVRLAYVLDGAPSRAMSLAKVDRLFIVHTTRAEALAALQSHPANTSSTGVGPSPGTSDLRLEAPALPDHVAEIRRAVVEYAEALGADDGWAIALAVSEAVTNAVVHAYPDSDSGSVRVTARALSREDLTVVVEDNGGGLQPRADSPGSGLGLPLLARLTTSLTIETRPEGGTRISMTFAL